MKRRLVAVLIFLLLGAATTIATSWYFAAGRTKDGEWFGHEEKVYSRVGGQFGAESWTVYRYERLGQVLIRRFPYVNSPESLPPYWDIGWPAERYVPVWASGLPPLEPREGMLGYAAVEGSGWPAIAMRTRYEEWSVAGQLGGQSFRQVTEGILLTPKAVVRRWCMLYRAKVVPLRPLWPGFAVNSLFYAAILWLPIRGPFALRRHIRRKRGLCVACGYDIRGTAQMICSECGHEVRAEAGT